MPGVPGQGHVSLALRILGLFSLFFGYHVLHRLNNVQTRLYPCDGSRIAHRYVSTYIEQTLRPVTSTCGSKCICLSHRTEPQRWMQMGLPRHRAHGCIHFTTTQTVDTRAHRPEDLCEPGWDCQGRTLFFSSFCLCRSSRAARRCSALSRCSSSRRRRSWSCFSRSTLAFSSFSSHTAFLAAGVERRGRD